MDWDHFLELMDYFGNEVTGDGGVEQPKNQRR